jgi:hypothetical protein
MYITFVYEAQRSIILWFAMSLSFFRPENGHYSERAQTDSYTNYFLNIHFIIIRSPTHRSPRC